MNIDVIKNRPNAFGRIKPPFDPGDANYPLERHLPSPRQMKRLVIPKMKTWALPRKEQLDQGNTPMCVDYTRKHWEISKPIHRRKGAAAGDYYVRCKAIDGFPGEEGTDARTMLKICQEDGIVGNYFWYTGDIEQASLWVLLHGPMWLGSYWTDSMLQTYPDGRMEVTGPFQYGHEVLVISRDTVKHRWGIVNSWGNDNFGVQGRGWMSDEDFKKLLDADGDLVGVTEQMKSK